MKYIATALLLGLVSPAVAADWPQWFGPKRDGHSPEKGLLKEWPRGGPKLAWTFSDTGIGYSAPAVVGKQIFILGSRKGMEELICLNDEGREQWKVPLGKEFDFNGNQWGAGPRATPTVADGHVYALGGYGELVCVEAAKGNVVWRKSMAANLKGEVNPIGGDKNKIGWGYSWSPLIDGDHLICYPGGPEGAVAALDRKKGDVVWRSKTFTAQASYSSPVVAELAGVRQYVVAHNGGVAGIAAKGGELLWDWKKVYADVVIATPLVHDNHVYISAPWMGSTCDLIKVSEMGGKFSADKVYSLKNTRVMKNTVGGSVRVDDHVYGYSDKRGWVCQDWKTGNEVWAQRGGKPGVGSVIYADGHLYLYGEDTAEVSLIEAAPKGWNLKGSFTLPVATKFKSPSGKNWTPPVIANGCLFLRDQEHLLCYKIK